MYAPLSSTHLQIDFFPPDHLDQVKSHIHAEGKQQIVQQVETKGSVVSEGL